MALMVAGARWVLAIEERAYDNDDRYVYEG
jgi:hypothetical protein